MLKIEQLLSINAFVKTREVTSLKYNVNVGEEHVMENFTLKSIAE